MACLICARMGARVRSLLWFIFPGGSVQELAAGGRRLTKSIDETPIPTAPAGRGNGLLGGG